MRCAGSLATSRRRVRGVALVVAMIMLAFIGLLSVGVLRDALVSGRIAAGSRLQAQASQFAQIALRHCESQLTLAPSLRTVPIPGPSSPPAWTVQANWDGGGAAPAWTLSAADFSGAGPPRNFPQCLAESAGAPGRFIVTARGFSPDFAVDVTGAMVAGSLVWLQSAVDVGPAAGAPPCPSNCPQALLRRAWQQLSTPPF